MAQASHPVERARPVGVANLAPRRHEVPLAPIVGEALSLPLARSALGSLSEGAAEQSEAEGVYCVEWYKLIILHRPS